MLGVLGTKESGEMDKSVLGATDSPAHKSPLGKGSLTEPAHSNTGPRNSDQTAALSEPFPTQKIEDAGSPSQHSRSTVEDLLESLLKIVKKHQSQQDVLADPEQANEAAALGSTDRDLELLIEPETIDNSDVFGHSPAALEALEKAFDKLSPVNLGRFRHPSKHSMSDRENGIQYEPCLVFGACPHGPKKKIRIMNDAEIQSENQIRRSARTKWKVKEGSEHLLDSWKVLWQHSPKSTQGLFEWPCEDTKRQDLQLNLIDALTSGQPEDYIDRTVRKDFRAIACWVGLIGIRLHDVYRPAPILNTGIVPNSINPISPITQIEVLIECLWACNMCKNATVGKVLEMCYKRKVFMQSSFEDPPYYVGSRMILLVHIQAIRVALYMVNLLFKHNVPKVTIDEDVDEIWKTRLSQVELRMRQNPRTPRSDRWEGEFFSINDFNLRDLQRLGQLQIMWTCHWDEHLQLQIKDESHILLLYWFQPGLSWYFTET